MDRYWFRAKEVQIDRWVEGYYVKMTTCEGREATFITTLPGKGSVNMILVDPETVGMFTGLPDKKGKWIFEGDLCDMSILGNDHILQKITIRNGAVGFEPVHPNKVHPEDRDWTSFWRSEQGDMWDPNYFTVIGNIHDNPELLEGASAHE